MRPEDYNMMVEKLASEIVEDVLCKEAEASAEYNPPKPKKVNPVKAQINYAKAGYYKPNVIATNVKQNASHAAKGVADAAAKAGAGVADAGKATVEFVKKHPKGVGAGVAGAALGTAAIAGGLAAYKHHKKKKEEQKEKVAAYYEDALLAKQAAEEAWALADQFEDSMAVSFIKQAAEEAYEEAEAQAEAAENVFAAIENDELNEDCE